MMSVGVFIHTRMFRQSRQTTTVRTLPMTAAVHTMFVTNFNDITADPLRFFSTF